MWAGWRPATASTLFASLTRNVDAASHRCLSLVPAMAWPGLVWQQCVQHGLLWPCSAEVHWCVTVEQIKYKPPVQLSCQVQDVWLEQEDAQLLHDGEEVTLMDWGNAIIEKVQRGTDGHTVTGEHV